MSIVGIDPGLAGAVAVLDANGTLDALADTPSLVLKGQRGTRQVYDVPGMAALLRPYAGPQCHVCIEESQPMPGQGTRSMFTIGYGYGPMGEYPGYPLKKGFFRKLQTIKRKPPLQEWVYHGSRCTPACCSMGAGASATLLASLAAFYGAKQGTRHAF